MKYEVKGTFKHKGKQQKYTKEVYSESEKLAKEKILSLIGGKQKIKRKDIMINEIYESKGEKNASN